MKFISIFSLFTGLLLSAPFFAQTSNANIEVVWPVSSVELHEEGARVEHKGNAYLTGESTVVSVVGVASKLDVSSLQIDLPQGLSVNSVQFEVRERPNSRSLELAQINDSIKILDIESRMYRAVLHTLSEERAFLAANRSIGSEQEVLLVDDVVEMADFLRERNQLLALEVLETEIDLEEVALVVDDLKERKQVLKNIHADTEGVVTMELKSSSSRPKSKEITISYLTPNAGWHTQYEANWDGKDLVMNRSASIVQTTGVNWGGAPITLISGRPSGSLRPIRLRDWVIEAPEQVKAYSEAGMRMSSSWIYTDAMSSGATVKSYTGGPRYKFELESSPVLIGDANPVLVKVDEFSFSGEVRYYAVPATHSKAYGVIHCSDWSDKRLMEGRAQIIANDTYLGQFRLKVPIVGDTLELPLGPDPRILCSRVLKAESSESSRLGAKKQVTSTWELTVENFHQNKVSIDLLDRIPRVKGRDDSVEILVVASDEGVVDTINHEVRWDVNLEPGEKRVVTVTITVTYPRSGELKNF